jgi:outer membrane immunogenic protein
MWRVALRATAFAAVCLSGSAWAADLTPVIPTAPMSWAGGYLGLEGGYDWGKFHATGTVSETKTVLDKYKTTSKIYCNPCQNAKDSSWTKTYDSDYKGSGGELGVFGGYRWENAHGHVFGIEGDVNWKDLSGTSDPVLKWGPDKFGEVTTSVDWYGTLRGTIGKAFGKTLIYGTGGLAFGGVSSSVDAFKDPVDTSGVRVGWTVGLGLAHAITENVFIKLEWVHVDLGQKNVFDWSKSWKELCYNDTVSKSISDSVKFDAVRVGIAFKFGQKAPAISVSD